GPQEEMFTRLIGPESQQRAQTDGRTVYGVFTEEGIDDLELADRDPLARINRIIQRLRPRPGHDNPSGEPPVDCFDNEDNFIGKGAPSMYFFNTLTYHNEHFGQYRWRPTRPTYTEDTPAERPRKKDDHTVDNLGHILVAIGDSLPDVPENSRPRSAEERYVMDHFERELAAAQARTSGHEI